MFAQKVKQTDWPLEYKGIKVQSSPSKKVEKEGIEIDIGEPFIIAAKDDSPGEGNFTAPTIYNFGGVLYVNWSFDWDVVDANLPDVTVHFSKDRGNSWFGSEILYTVGLRKPGELSFPGKIDEIIYANSHLNVRMAPAGENKVLVVHDATRRDESAVNDWLKKHGHGLVIGRIISVKN